MKNFLLLIVAVVALACCAKRSPNDLERWVVDDGKPKVLATTAIVQDLVKRIGGDDVKVIAVINGQLDPHSYEMVKGDGEKFHYADVIFGNGLMLEHSASMQYQLKHHAKVVLLGDSLLERHPGQIIYVNGQLDPHVWMDIALWSECIEPIVAKLSEVDPAHKEAYAQRGEETRAQFLQADAEIRERMQAIPAEKRYLITSHDAFNYHVRRYLTPPGESWRERMKALQGLAPDEQISLLQVREIVNHIARYNITVIFPESNLSRDSLEKVQEGCHKLGKEIMLSEETLYGDTLGGKDYLEMLKYNARVLERNLNGNSSQ